MTNPTIPKQIADRLPPKNAHGNFPAIAATDALIAQGLVRDRLAAGLTQGELARRAGIHVETLNRAEKGVVVPDVRTLRKFDKALQAAKGSQRWKERLSGSAWWLDGMARVASPAGCLLPNCYNAHSSTFLEAKLCAHDSLSRTAAARSPPDGSRP